MKNNNAERKRKSAVAASPAGVEVKPARWVLPDRVGFSDWVHSTFAYPRPQQRDENSNIQTDEVGISLFPQQKFVRDFLQADSPYAGLILYHGLGVGKSCAAIAAIRALERNYKVVVMLPASIKKNFLAEMRKCGGHAYAEEQAWTRKNNNDDDEGWIATRDERGTPFSLLPPEAQQEVRDQLDSTIQSRVEFISYNGLTARRVAEIVNSPVNMFDGAAVVIDEVHKFISQVTNERTLKLVYERLMAADPRKVILLTGTPFMNDVMELPYLVNLAHGFVRIVEFQVASAPHLRDARRLEELVHAVLSRNPFVNRYVVRPAATSSLSSPAASLVVAMQLTPNGFQRDGGMYVKALAAATPDSPTTPTRVMGAGGWFDFVRKHVAHELREAAGGVDIVVNASSSRSRGGGMTARNKMLLPVGDAFLAHFTTNQGYRLKNVDALARRVSGTVSYFGYYDAATYPRVGDMNIVRLPMSDRQFDEYKDVRAYERRLEETAIKLSRSRATTSGDGGASAGRSGSDGMGAYRPRSRAVSNFVFPADVERPQRREVAAYTDADKVDRAYEEALREAVETLRRDHTYALLSDDDAVTTMPGNKTKRNADAKGNVVAVDDGRQLAQHSPKFYAILSRLARARYPVLVYSEFRRMEGIGILAACLDVNGFSEVKVRKQDGVYRVFVDENDTNTINDTHRHHRRPRYIVYDNVDPEAREILLNAFNSEFNKMPPQAADDVRRILADDDGWPSTETSETSSSEHLRGNTHGELARALLVTESGSEGINLKNVREVHAMEPFWNSNRVNQVVGRAVRAHSHAALPPEERRVDVFLYMAVLAPRQAEERAIKLRDGGISSDQHVFRITQRKDALVAQMQDVLKMSAADCRLHRDKHMRIDPGHRCLGTLRNRKPDDFVYGFSFDDDLIEGGLPHEEGTTTRLKPVRSSSDGRRFYMDPETGKLYDYEALKNEGRLVQVQV